MVTEGLQRVMNVGRKENKKKRKRHWIYNVKLHRTRENTPRPVRLVYISTRAIVTVVEETSLCFYNC